MRLVVIWTVGIECNLRASLIDATRAKERPGWRSTWAGGGGAPVPTSATSLTFSSRFVYSEIEHESSSTCPVANERLIRQILVEIDRNPSVSQRQLSADLGVSIGIVNWHMKRFVTKGLVKLQKAPVRRYLYYLTRDGFAEKARLTAEYLKASFNIFHLGRRQYEALFALCDANRWTDVLLLGNSELAELACIALTRTDEVKARAILDPRSARGWRGRLPVHSSVSGALQEFPGRRVDALVGTHFELRFLECYDLDAIRGEVGLDQSRFLIPAFLQ